MHSQHAGSLQRFNSRAAIAFALVVLCAAGASAVRAAAVAELDDAAVRIQYAFLTDDVRGVEAMLSDLERLEVPSTLTMMREYYLGYAQWKRAQLYARRTSEPRSASTSAVAGKAAQACIQHSQAATRLNASLAESHAIEAACTGLSQMIRSSNARTSQSSCARSKPMRSALQLDPHNPRVQLVECLCLVSDTDRSAEVFEKLQSVVEAFEASPPSRPGQPDWGHAEALALLGAQYLQRGDPLAARDALERALVIAPDFREAQNLLQTAATRPR